MEEHVIENPSNKDPVTLSFFFKNILNGSTFNMRGN